MRDKVALGWISPGLVHDRFMHSVLEVAHARADRLWGHLSVSGSLLSRERNELATRFLESDAEWLLMVDTDEQLTVPAFDKLVSAAHDTERPVVAGLYFGTVPAGGLIGSPVPHLYRRAADGVSMSAIADYPTDTVIEVDAAGTGALLVHRGVFETIRERADPHEGKDWCWFRDLPLDGKWLGEDLYFCRRVKAAGFPIHAHTGAVLAHQRRYWLDNRMFEAMRESAAIS